MAEPADDMGAMLGDAAMPDDDMAEESSPVMEPLDDFGAAIRDAFPDNDWTPERVESMKEAIRICLEEDKGGGYDSGGAGGGDKGLALIFGEPKPKKKS